jgi:hypothetical protein
MREVVARYDSSSTLRLANSVRIDREHGGDRRTNGLCAHVQSDLIERIGPNQRERQPAKCRIPSLSLETPVVGINWLRMLDSPALPIVSRPLFSGCSTEDIDGVERDRGINHT